jgi:phosphoribosylglycinamide formyltransferase-1
MTRIAVFASGRGSNLNRILEACQSGEIPAAVNLIVCNEPEAGAVRIAHEARVPLLLADHRDYPHRLAHEQAIVDALRLHRIDWVVLAGYRRILTPFLIDTMYDARLGHARILNIHPADTAQYQGPDGYGWAVGAGLAQTAITVHVVEAGVDTGPIVLQAPVPVLPSDGVDSLQQRGLAVEHRLYPEAIRFMLEREEVLASCAAS